MPVQLATYGTDDLDTHWRMGDLASAYQDAGRIEEAIPLFEKDLPFKQTKFGPDSQLATYIMNRLERAYEQTGQTQKVVALHSDRERRLWELTQSPMTNVEVGMAALRSLVEDRGSRGQWAEVDIDLARLVQLEPTVQDNWYHRAPLLLELGDQDGYRKHVAAMLLRYGGTPDPEIAERTAKAALLLPPDPDQLAAAARMAALAVADTNSSNLPWREATQALVEYRQGRFELARLWVGKALAYPAPETPLIASRNVLAYSILAMAQYRLGHTNEARSALDTARQIFRAQLPQANSSRIGPFWHDWLIGRLLLREAEALVEEQTR